MEVIVFESETYKKIVAEDREAIRLIFAEELKKVQQEKWCSPERAMEILNCKEGKMQKLRDQGKIRFSKDGRDILYYTPSLYAYIEANEVTN